MSAARELRVAAAAEALHRWPDSALGHAQLDGYTFDSKHVYEMQRRAFEWGARWAHGELTSKGLNQDESRWVLDAFGEHIPGALHAKLRRIAGDS